MRAARLVWLLNVACFSARAAVYENTITIDDEEDLLDLFQRGDLSEATLETLLELHREGVDLNHGSREQLYDLPGLGYRDVDAILEYRRTKGRIEAPVELVGAGAITAEQLLELAPFIRLDPADPKLPVSGKVRLSSQFSIKDSLAPPALLSAQLRGPVDLSAGVLLLTSRLSLAPPTADPLGTGALTSSGFSYQMALPRFYLEWAPEKWRLVAGTFALGFAERLTLDVTRRVTPRGITLANDFVRDSELSTVCRVSGAVDSTDPFAACGDPTLYVTPDYHSRELFRGLAVSVEDVGLGEGASLSAYGFASYQSRSLYQYELFDRHACPGPREDGDDDCAAPPVLLPDGAQVKFSTLPAVFDELAGGGHLTLRPDYRFTFGATGYGAVPLFDRTAPLQLDFQEWSRYPNGGAFGAAGLDASAVVGPLNLFIEGTRTFNQALGGGGGWGVEQRTTYNHGPSEVELSLRFYDAQFGHPYGRPISSPDEYDGQSARNEAGARVRLVHKPSADWRLRARADFWVTPFSVPDVSPAGVANLYALARVDFLGWSRFQPALWVDARNRNLGANERGQSCASGSTTFSEGDPYLCNGDLYRVTARLSFVAHPQYARLAMQGAFSWLDDARYQDAFRNDVMVWAELRSRPLDVLQLRLKSRYHSEAIDDPEYLEESWWTFLEVAWLPRSGSRLALRYDLFVWLDHRASTDHRTPNPEHRLVLDLRAAF